MEWQQLEYFIAIAKSQHMTNAAKELSVTQPALSRSIATLEKEFGVELFERRGRNLVLNRYGQLLLGRAQTALSEIEKAKQEIANQINPGSGIVSLGFPHILGAELFPAMLGAFRERYADIRFDLNQCSIDDLVKRILNNDCDFGITTWESVDEAFHWHLIGTSELYLTLPIHHPWAGKDSICLEELQGVPYVGLKPSCALSYTVEALLARSRVEPDTVYRADELDMVAGLVSAGYGVSLLPKTLGTGNYPMAWVKVDDPASKLTVGVVWKKDRRLTPVSEVFLGFVRDRYPRSSERSGA
ncbi:LysR family transcriptional regulator [Paenibacillus sp. NFR01]|uniref:LysR family transcriptional regulator n=1 Tax=Paenibacillus sp. NFR01 TaxID=1566279 RepID=UPI0008C993C3|nr:LysR family transcriptional regulator [Paenibacillus sp. NFR01]SEU09687.1 DNA-binding transcriptional regulator, LysR family [Paenibacillus sp. NFR01]